MTSPWLLLAAAVGGTLVIKHGKAYGHTDQTPPTITITSGNTFNSQTILVTGTASDNVGVASVYVKVSDPTTGTDLIPFKLATGTTAWSVSMNIAKTGPIKITAKAKDNAGNEYSVSMDASIDVIVDPYTYIDNPTTKLSLVNRNYIAVRDADITATKGSNSTCLHADHCDHLWIQRGVFKTASYPLHVRYCSNVLVQGSESYDASILSTSINFSTNVRVENLKCHDSADNPLDLGIGNDGVVNINPEIYRALPVITGSNSGIHYDSAKNVVQKGGNIYDCAYDGIKVQATQGADIYGGTIARMGKEGISVIPQGTVQANKIRIHDYNITGTTNAPIYVNPASLDVWIWAITSDKKIQVGSTLIDPATGTYENAAKTIHVNKGPPPGYVQPI